jgi:tetratricopeptide (TPR) repeat protein
MLSPSLKQQLVYALLITKQLEVIAEDAAATRAPAPSAPVASPSASASSQNAPGSQLGRVQLQRQVSAKAPLAVEERLPAMSRRRDPRVSSPTLTPLPKDAVAAVAEAVAAKAAEAAAAAANGSLSAELAEQKKTILERAEQIMRQDYFAMLGIARDATKEEVQSAYFALAKTWHPDKLPPALADVREQCSKVFAHLSEAQQTLSDEEKRNRYMKLIKDGGATPDDQAIITNVLEAATNFQKADICLKRQDLAQAETYCRQAHKQDPTQAEYLALLAWVEALKPANQTPQATLARIEMLDKAIGMNSRCERAFFYRGMLHKRLSNDAKAYKDFKVSAELNPRNIDAVREVRLWNMRKAKGAVPSSTMPPPMPGASNASPAARRASGRPPPKQDDASRGGLFGKLFKK